MGEGGEGFWREGGLSFAQSRLIFDLGGLTFDLGGLTFDQGGLTFDQGRSNTPSDRHFVLKAALDERHQWPCTRA